MSENEKALTTEIVVTNVWVTDREHDSHAMARLVVFDVGSSVKVKLLRVIADATNGVPTNDIMRDTAAVTYQLLANGPKYMLPVLPRALAPPVDIITVALVHGVTTESQRHMFSECLINYRHRAKDIWVSGNELRVAVDEGGNLFGHVLNAKAPGRSFQGYVEAAALRQIEDVGLGI